MTANAESKEIQENPTEVEQSAVPGERIRPDTSFPEGNFSLYDAGNWEDEEEGDAPYIGVSEAVIPPVEKTVREEADEKKVQPDVSFSEMTEEKESEPVLRIPEMPEEKKAQPVLPIPEITEEKESEPELPIQDVPERKSVPFFLEEEPQEEENEAPVPRKFSLAALLGLDDASKSAKKAKHSHTKKEKGKHESEEVPQAQETHEEFQRETAAQDISVPTFEVPQKPDFVPVIPDLAPEVPAFTPDTAAENSEDEIVTVALHREDESPVPEATGIFPGAKMPDSPVAEETRKFTLNDLPAADEMTEGTRKFNLSSLQDEEPIQAAPAVPAEPDTIIEPEVAPTEPGISHEIINAIFTNPQPNTLPSEVFTAEDSRPRKLMSITRFDLSEPEEDEPETQFIEPSAPKEEPIVEDVKSYKPTARISAKKADEAGDEFTAFANAKRSLIAEIGDNDPFNSAIEIPKEEKPEVKPEEKAEKAEEADDELPAIHDDVAEEVVPVTVEPAARLPKDIEVPLWAQQAMVSLGDSDISLGQKDAPEANARRKRRSTFGISEDLTAGMNGGRTEMDIPAFEEPTAASVPRSGLDAIARHDAVKKHSVLTGKTFGVIDEDGSASVDLPLSEPVRSAPVKASPIVTPRTAAPVRPRQASAQPINGRAQNPQSISQQRAAQTRELPREPRNAPRQPVRRAPNPQGQARPQQNPVRPAQQNLQSNPQRSMQKPASRPAETKASTGKINNLPRLIIVAVVGIILVALLFWGLISGIKAIVRKASGSNTNQTSTEQSEPVQDENAPVVTQGERNGHPTHVFTFKGNDNDIIYVSGDNLPNSYNVPIVSGIGTLEIDDSELIGNRYANEDIEVTINSVLHEASSGKETQLSPVTFTVTPPVAYLEIVIPEGGVADTTLGTFQVKVRVEIGSVVTIDGSDVSDMITEETSELGSIVFNVSVDPIGANEIPVTVMKEGCKSVTETITITRPEMSVPIELDPSTPSSSTTDNVVISGSVEPGVTVSVNTPTVGNVTMNEDGSFSFTAQLSFGPNEIIITASDGTDTSDLTHTVTYTPSFNDYVAMAYKMNYNDLTAFAGKYQPFKCTGYVIEAYTSEPYTCLFNVSTEDDPKYIYLEMVDGKPLSEDHRYTVYADVHEDGTHEEYPYLIGRYFVVDDE